MDFAGRWNYKSSDEQTATYDNQKDCRKELYCRFMFANFHCKMLCMWRIIVKFAYQKRKTILTDPDTSTCK